MNIYGAVILGALIGLIVGAVFHDLIIDGLANIVFVAGFIMAFIPCMLYFPFRFVIHPADPIKWEQNKDYFKYKKIGKNFFICYEPHASRPWKSIFFLRLKISS